MRMIRIQEGFERGVFVLQDGLDRGAWRVGTLPKMLREAEAMAGSAPTSVLVVNQDHGVMKCLRYLPGRTVIEEDPRLIYDQPVL